MKFKLPLRQKPRPKPVEAPPGGLWGDDQAKTVREMSEAASRLFASTGDDTARRLAQVLVRFVEPTEGLAADDRTGVALAFTLVALKSFDQARADAAAAGLSEVDLLYLCLLQESEVLFERLTRLVHEIEAAFGPSSNPKPQEG